MYNTSSTRAHTKPLQKKLQCDDYRVAAPTHIVILKIAYAYEY